MWNFQRKSQKFRYPTDRCKYTSSAHALHGSLGRYSWCQSVLMFPLDLVIDSLVRCKNPIGSPRGGAFSTAKSEISQSNGQIQVHKQRVCIVWVKGTPSIVSKRAHHSVRSSNRLTCPLRNFGNVEFSTEKSEISLSNGQMQVHKQRACIAWVTRALLMVSKRAHVSVGSSNSPTCPLQKS